jgi:protoporphyrin/coproporphyrin ferrochelatase
MRAAVLATCHGSVDSLDDLPAFLRNIRHGHPAPQEVVDEVTRRYRAVGGSPLMRISAEQASALEARLDGERVWLAGRLWPPTPAEVLAEMKRAGVERVVSLPLAPQSVHVYHASVKAAAAPLGLEVACVPSYGLEPALLDACLEVVEVALATLAAAERAGAVVVLTAHSLPKRVIDAGDPYEKDFREMAGAVAKRLEARGTPSRIAFQSQGMGGGAWLGPDLPTTFAELAAAGARVVVVAPIGFVADHVETLFDLDIEAHEIARGRGIDKLVRAPAFNARPRFVDALEAVARRALSDSTH